MVDENKKRSAMEEETRKLEADVEVSAPSAPAAEVVVLETEKAMEKEVPLEEADTPTEAPREKEKKEKEKEQPPVEETSKTEETSKIKEPSKQRRLLKYKKPPQVEDATQKKKENPIGKLRILESHPPACGGGVMSTYHLMCMGHTKYTWVRRLS